MSDQVVEITPQVRIPYRELRFTFARASGAGGQHVNKVSTRVTLHFSLKDSQSLTPSQKKMVFSRLGSRINRQGVLQITAGRQRSQQANRREAVTRFADLLRKALVRYPDRKKTRPSRRSRERRLQQKAHRARLKRLRRSPSRGQED